MKISSPPAAAEDEMAMSMMGLPSETLSSAPLLPLNAPIARFISSMATKTPASLVCMAAIIAGS